MALWLQCQEAVILRRTFLAWLHPNESNKGSGEAGNSEDDENEDNEEANEQDLIEVQLQSHVPFVVPTLPSTTYRIAKHPPIPNATITYLETTHGAVDFLQALTAFLARASPASPPPSKYDRFDVFKQISVSIPFNCYLALNQPTIHCIRASPPRPAAGRRSAFAGHFDPAFIVEDAASYKLGIKAMLDGSLRVGQIRVIFKLPPQFGKYPHPLAYVEWFTPLRTKDPVTGMYLINRSTRSGRRNAEIVSATRIVRACHLIAKCGRQINHTWTTDNILEEATTFWVNRYIHVDTFTLTQ